MYTTGQIPAGNQYGVSDVCVLNVINMGFYNVYALDVINRGCLMHTLLMISIRGSLMYKIGLYLYYWTIPILSYFPVFFRDQTYVPTLGV